MSSINMPVVLKTYTDKQTVNYSMFGEKGEYSPYMVIIDLLGAVIFILAIHTIYVTNRNSFKTVHAHQFSILSDFFLSLSSLLCFLQQRWVSLQARKRVQVIFWEWLSKSTSNFFAFYQPLLHNNSKRKAALQIILAKVVNLCLTLLSTLLSPSFTSCSSCLLCVSTRPVFEYMTPYLCITTAIITSSGTTYIFRRQKKQFPPYVVILVLV